MQHAYHARIASQLRFRFGHKSFYRLGIRSCIRTKHKTTPFSMTSSCILGFQATQLVSHRLGLILFILCLLYVGESKVFLRQITAGCKYSSVRFDKWLEILTVEDLTPKERRPELQREQRRRGRARSSSDRDKVRE